MQEKYLVFTGRPNVGKSSLIKELTGLNIAIGKHPGTTRKITKYPLNDGLVLVDLPGLGKMLGASKKVEEEVNQQIIEFLEYNAQNIVLAVAVLDVSTFLEVTWRLEKKGIQSIDVEMVQFLAKIMDQFPIIVANKIDKATKREIEDNLIELTHRISDGNPRRVKDQVFPVSVKKGTGLGKLKSSIHTRLVMKGFKTPFKIK